MNITINPPIGFSELGQRQNNEDYLFPLLDDAATENYLFLVCDGVGGAEKGEVASQLAAHTINDFLLEEATQNELDKTSIQAAVETTLQAFDKAVLQDETKKGMATTLTLWLSTTQGVWLSHIGDSRIYHIRNNSILYQSKDHTLLNQLLDQEIITPEEAAVSTQKNVISRAIQAGQDRPVKAESFLQTDLQKGDYFFLCSDGVLEFVSDEELVSILQQEKTNTEKLAQLKAICQENPTKDNHTAYLIQLNEISEDLEVEINAEAEVKEEITEEVKQEVTEKVKQEITEEVKQEVTEEVKQEVTEKVKQKVTEEVKQEVTEKVKQEITEEVKQEKQEPKTEQKENGFMKKIKKFFK